MVQKGNNYDVDIENFLSQRLHIDKAHQKLFIEVCHSLIVIINTYNQAMFLVQFGIILLVIFENWTRPRHIMIAYTNAVCSVTPSHIHTEYMPEKI